MGDRRYRPGPAGSVAADRIRSRHRFLFFRRTRAGLVGGIVADARCMRRAHSRCALGRSHFRLRLRSPPSQPGSRRRHSKACASSVPHSSHPVGYAEISGFVENREERERSDRFLLRVHRFDAARVEAKPDRVRLSVRKGTAPAVGSFVTLRARLNPPLRPLATRRLRLRARSLFPGHRRDRLCARADHDWPRRRIRRDSGSTMRRPSIPCAMPSMRASAR